MDQEMREWVEVYPGIEGKVLRTENDLKHILRLWESERKTVGKLAVIDLAATVIALQAELQCLRSIEAAALAFAEFLQEDSLECHACWQKWDNHAEDCAFVTFQAALGQGQAGERGGSGEGDGGEEGV